MNMMTVTSLLVVLFLIAGIILNLLVVIGMLKKKMKGIRDGIVVSFACCALIEICFGYIWEAYGSFIDDSSIVLCKIAGFATTFPAFISILHLVIMACERYLSIIYPMMVHNHFVEAKRALYFVIPAWVFGFTWACFPFLGWGDYIRETDHSYRCSIIATDNSVGAQTYNYSLLFLYFFIPSITIIFFCVRVQLELNAMRKRAASDAGVNSAIADDSKKAERQHFMLVCVVIGTYYISWTPYAIASCWYAFFNEAPHKLVSYSALFAKSAVVTNPLVYAFCYKEFREALKKKVFCRRRQQVFAADIPMSSL